MMTRTICFLLVCVSAFSLWGCQRPSATTSNGSDAEVAEDGHDHHGHAHSHDELGPHQGHVIELGDEAYHAEWLHDDDTGLITVHLLDSDIQNDVPIISPTISIERTIDDDTKTYLLPAVAPSDTDPPRSSQFEITDPALIEALKLAGKGVEAKIEVEIDGQKFSASFAHAAH